MEVRLNPTELKRLRAALGDKPVKQALRKAGSTALRDMRSEASKRVRERKRIKAKAVREALIVRRPKGGSIDGMEWRIDVSGRPVRLADAYPRRQTKRGVSTEINRGQRTLIRSAFLATMRSGHTGVFLRRDTKRLPIREVYASRPVDALLHEGEAQAVATRGAESLARTFRRVLPLELERARG